MACLHLHQMLQEHPQIEERYRSVLSEIDHLLEQWPAQNSPFPPEACHVLLAQWAPSPVLEPKEVELIPPLPLEVPPPVVPVQAVIAKDVEELRFINGEGFAIPFLICHPEA